MLLNAHHTALWCVPLALAAVAWRARRLRVAPRLPARYLRIGVAGLLTLAVLVGFHTLNGIDAGSSLLVAMATLKLTETVRRRDWLIVLGAALFLLLAACLDGQALWRLPLYAAELWLLCARALRARRRRRGAAGAGAAAPIGVEPGGGAAVCAAAVPVRSAPVRARSGPSRAVTRHSPASAMR